MMPESMPDPAAAISQDVTNGYEVTLRVTADGFTISEPEPLDDDEPLEGEPVPTLADALKHIMMIVKENPLGDDEQGQLEAGYLAGRGAGQ